MFIPNRRLLHMIVVLMAGVPSNYYTSPMTYPASNGLSSQPIPPKEFDNAGFYDSSGKYYPYVKNSDGDIGYYDNSGQFQKLKSLDNNAKPNNVQINPNEDNIQNEDKTNEGKNNVNDTLEAGDDKDLSSSDNEDAQSQGTVVPNSETLNNDESVKKEETINSPDKSTEKELNAKPEDSTTEKRKVVLLSDEYIKTLENYLNSQDIEVRKMGAHKIVDRLEEDSSRKDDPALTALVNKMLQDPAMSIRAIALSIVESGILSGNNETAEILKNIQSSDKGYGLDATQATSALLQMAEKTVEKEVPVDKPKKDTNKQEDENKQAE